MANGQAGQGGGRLYSEDDVEILLNETAKRAANEAIKSVRPTRQQQREEREERDTDEELGMSSKLVKQLQTTVSVFNTLKEFSSNPLQKAIESKVGDLAAGVIEQAFTRPSGPPPKRDLVETFLNSQLGFGLGQGLGQRAPEFVESISRMFGKDKAEQMIDGVIGKYGNKGGGSSGGSGISDQGRGLPPPSSSPDVGPEAGKQSEKEILLSLDPNNPEHVSAYAETQGGISVDVARKMLMIHQDEFIKQMKTQGANVEELSKIRGSHIDKPSSSQSSSSQRVETPQDAYVPPSDYADFREVPQPPSPAREPIQDFDANPGEDINHSSGNEKGDENQLNPQLLQFTEDIGKIMGDMVGKMESMNNTIFVLQNELNEIKSGKTIGQTPIGQPIVPPTMQPPSTFNTPTIINKPIDRMIDSIDNIPNDSNDNNIPNNIIDSGNIPGASLDRVPEPLRDQMDNMPMSEPLGIDDTNEFMKPPKPPAFSKTSAGFFEENVQDINDFERELQEEASAAAKKFEEAMQQQKKSEQQIPPLPIQPALVKSPKPVPPLSHQLSHPLSPPLMDIDNTNDKTDTTKNVDKAMIENMINMENLNIDDPIQPPSLQTIPSPPPLGIPIGIPLKKQPDEKDETDENTSNNDKSHEKKYVRPINRKKNIFTPSFKSDKERDK